MATIAQLLKLSAEIDSETPELDIQVLLRHVLQCSRAYLYTWPEREVPIDQEHRFYGLLERRKQGEPVAHLLEHQEFWSLSLRVSPATLIPRADTELLVEKVLELDLPDTARVLDLGTGTGAIALALASERPGWRVVAVDSAPGAIQLARENVRNLKLKNIEVLLSDWFGDLEGGFDLIVGNPPYIADGDPHLSLGDLRFEPRSALVAAAGGLADLEYIISNAKHHLNKGGWIALEHGYDQQGPVQALLAENAYVSVRTWQDLAGLPRVSIGKRPD